MHFVKMHGAENDYIFVNNFLDRAEDPASLAREMSERHRGIGSDGLILLLPSRCADARMRIFNPDGSEAEMCGNGARCAAKLLHDDDLVRGKEVTLETLSGIRRVRLLFDISEESVFYGALRTVTGAEVEMGVPVIGHEAASAADHPNAKGGRFCGSEGNGGSDGAGNGNGNGNGNRFARGRIPPPGWAGEPNLDVDSVEVGGRRLDGLCVSVGNPHFVIFVDDVLGFSLSRIAPRIETLPIFPNRTNVEFVQICNDGSLLARVWERGTGETRACGTGAVASVAAAMARGMLKRDQTVTVRLTGGNLTVRWDGRGPAWLAGEAVEVYRGNWLRRQRVRESESDILPYLGRRTPKAMPQGNGRLRS